MHCVLAGHNGLGLRGIRSDAVEVQNQASRCVLSLIGHYLYVALCYLGS